MANTIGSAPRPAPPSRASSVKSTQTGAAPAPEKKQWNPADTFTPADYVAAGKEKQGDPLKSDKTPETLAGMSNEDLANLSPEEVTGMTMNQFMAYEKALDKDGGPGRDSLDPKLAMSLARKSFVNNMMLKMLAYRG